MNVSLPIADWIIIAIVCLSGLISLWRGFVKEALSLLVWLVALAVTFLFLDDMQAVLAQWIESPSLKKTAAGIILFFGTLISGSLVTALIAKLVQVTGLSGTDRLLGVVFGCLRGVALLLAALIFIPKMMPLEEEVWYQESTFIPQILMLEEWAIEVTGEIYNSSKTLFSKDAA